jgi:hypothetical protein
MTATKTISFDSRVTKAPENFNEDEL